MNGEDAAREAVAEVKTGTPLARSSGTISPWGIQLMHNGTVVSDAELQGADAIHTVDPQDPNAAGHQLWGHRSEKSQVQPDASQKIVEVPLPSDHHVALLALIDRIGALKGSLPPDVEVLRRNLAS